MKNTNFFNLALLNQVKENHKQVAADDLGGSPLEKCYLMSWLINELHLKCFVEIGVYKGKSLFSVAPFIKENGGLCYGIDPYLADNLRENDLPENIRKIVEHSADTLDFEDLYAGVVSKCTKMGLDDTVTLMRQTSEDAYLPLIGKHRSSFIDMLHIDGNHDTVFVHKDAELYIPLIRDGGIIVFDDINWDSVNVVFEREKGKHTILLETEYYSILAKNKEFVEGSALYPTYVQIAENLPKIREWVLNDNGTSL